MTHTAAFIQVVEVWRRNGDALHYAGGLYGRHVEFAELSANTTFRRGEGLPGSVWESGRARVWNTLGAGFVRAEAARAAGLAAGVGIPVMHGAECEAVVTLLCGAAEQSRGCVEIWTPNSLRELVLSAGYYGGLKDFENLSKLLRFQSGTGLPGLTWQRGLPQVMSDLPKSTSFLRAAAAREAGIDGGLALPLYLEGRVAEVLVFLSARATPLARAFEVWCYDDAHACLRLTESHYAPELSAVAAESKNATYAAGEGVRGSVLASGLPLAFRGGGDPAGADLEGGVAIPVLVEGMVRAVVVMLM